MKTRGSMAQYEQWVAPIHDSPRKANFHELAYSYGLNLACAVFDASRFEAFLDNFGAWKWHTQLTGDYENQPVESGLGHLSGGWHQECHLQTMRHTGGEPMGSQWLPGKQQAVIRQDGPCWQTWEELLRGQSSLPLLVDVSCIPVVVSGPKSNFFWVHSPINQWLVCGLGGSDSFGYFCWE